MKYQVGDEVVLRNGEQAKVKGVRQLYGPEAVTEIYLDVWGVWGSENGFFFNEQNPHHWDITCLISRENPQRSKADRVLIELANIGEEYSMSFKSIMNQTGLSEFEVSACCRYLACEGYARFTKGLMNYEEMQVAGAGYAVTSAGVARVKEWL